MYEIQGSAWKTQLVRACHVDANGKIEWDVKTACNQGKTI